MKYAIFGLALGAALFGGCSKNEHQASQPTNAAEAKPEVPTAPAATPKTAKPKAAQAAEAATAALTIGAAAPDFELPGLDGKPVKLSSYRGKVVVLEWMNPGCPFVKISHSKGSLKGLGNAWQKKDVVWLAINSGAPGKQGHGVEASLAWTKKFSIDYPVLLDPEGKVGKMYGAKYTPHMYIIDKEGKLAYRGGIDNSPDADQQSPENGKLIEYVKVALTDIAAGRTPAATDTEAYGCSVKYAN